MNYRVSRGQLFQFLRNFFQNLAGSGVNAIPATRRIAEARGDAQLDYLRPTGNAGPGAQNRGPLPDRDPNNSVEVVIEYNRLFGDPSSLYVNQNGTWEIYDPDGACARMKNAGEGDVVRWESRYTI